jgi:phosphoribosylaminoimidazole-succinocarboxamide synthase
MAKPHHLISADVREYPEPFRSYSNVLEERSLLVKKTRVIPIECAIRNYLYGSAFREYQENQCISGHRLWPNLRQAEKFINPLFVPATKSSSGHDKNLTIVQVIEQVGLKLALELENRSKMITQEASRYAESRGVLIADTKFEFGFDRNDQLILIDGVLTPDSSRFWLKELWKTGQRQEAFDKQFVRDYVDSIRWDHNPPAPELPQDIVFQTYERYLEIKKRLFETKPS